METAKTEQYEVGAVYSRQFDNNPGDVCLRADSGNIYFVHASGTEHVRVSNRCYAMNDRVPAVFNGVTYDVSADFTLMRSESRPWEPFHLSMERIPYRGKISDYTPAAAKKARAEIAEVARLYVETCQDHMRAWVRYFLKSDVERARRELESAQEKADRLRCEVKEAEAALRAY